MMYQPRVAEKEYHAADELSAMPFIKDQFDAASLERYLKCFTYYKRAEEESSGEQDEDQSPAEEVPEIPEEAEEPDPEDLEYE